MRKNKYMRLMLLYFCIAIFCIGCGNKNLESSSNDKKTDNDDIQIENNCKNLTTEKAAIIAKEIEKIIIDTQKDVYKKDDFSIKFANEKKEETFLIDITVKSQWTRVREIEENPIIIGMRKAKEKLKTEEEKEKAEGIIQDFLVEMRGEEETEQVPEYLKLKLDSKSGNYELFVKEDLNDETKLYPMKEYYVEHYKENTEERMKLGEETLLEYMK